MALSKRREAARHRYISEMAPRVGVLLLWGVQLALADVYMQYPPGSNNRLDEGGGNATTTTD